MAGLLDGKRILVTGVLTPDSIAFHVAKIAIEQGAQVVLSSFGRAMRLTTRTAGRLPAEVPVVELDVADDEHLATLADRLREHVDGLDGVLHSIGFAPEAALGGNFLNTTWDDVATALRVSTYSLPALADGLPAAVRRPRVGRRRWTSTRRSPGRSTTGWAWPRPGSSRRRATSPATSARRAFG